MKSSQYISRKSQVSQTEISTRRFIRSICILGFLGTIFYLIIPTTELAYIVGKWYINFLYLTSLLLWLSLLGIWKMKKIAVLTYSITLIGIEIVLFKYNVMWNYVSLIIPAITISIFGYYFNKMT